MIADSKPGNETKVLLIRDGIKTIINVKIGEYEKSVKMNWNY